MRVEIEQASGRVVQGQAVLWLGVSEEAEALRICHRHRRHQAGSASRPLRLPLSVSVEQALMPAWEELVSTVVARVYEPDVTILYHHPETMHALTTKALNENGFSFTAANQIR